MVESSHGHFAMMAMVLLVLTHLYIFVPGPRRLKAAFVGGTFAATFLSEASGWLVRFVHPGFAILKPAAFLASQAFLGLMLGLLATFLVSGGATKAPSRSRGAARPTTRHPGARRPAGRPDPSGDPERRRRAAVAAPSRRRLDLPEVERHGDVLSLAEVLRRQETEEAFFLQPLDLARYLPGERSDGEDGALLHASSRRAEP